MDEVLECFQFFHSGFVKSAGKKSPKLIFNNFFEFSEKLASIFFFIKSFTKN